MAELDASKLPGEAFKELSEFLKKKLSAEVESEANRIVVKDVSNTRLRKATRWFLCKKKLSDEYRVLSDGKKLVIRKRTK
ncbi:MAG: hypothetical protein ACUVQ0_02060 [Thermoproteota archaeon]